MSDRKSTATDPRINAAVVRSIRRLRAQGKTIEEIADRHGLDVETVRGIANGYIYREIV